MKSLAMTEIGRFPILRHVATIAGGSALGQLAALAATPLLARIYSPAEFGEYAAFLAMCNVFLTTACLRYDAALNAADDKHVASLFGVSCIAALSTSLFVFLVASSPIGHFLTRGLVDQHKAAYFITAAAAICGLYQSTSAMAVRGGLFGLSGLLRAGQPIVFSAAAVLLPVGLIASCLLSFLTALPFALKFSARSRPANFGEMARGAWLFRKFPMVSLPTSMLDAFSLALPIWFISSQYSLGDAGNYAQVQRLLAAPLTLLALSIGQVYIKRSGDIVRTGSSPQLLQRQVVTYLATGALVLSAIIWLFFSPVLSALLGSGWRTDTLFLLLVFAPVAVRSCVSPVTGIFIVRNRLQVSAAWQTMYFGVTATAFYCLAGRISLEHMLLVYAVTEFLCYGVYLYLADWIAK